MEHRWGPQVAVHARASKKQGQPEPEGGRQPSLRTVLLILALVPIVTLTALWATSSTQLYVDWRRQVERNDVSTRAARPVMGTFFSLQEERRLSGAALADPAAYRKQLREQRARTDAAVKGVEALSGSGWNAPDDIRRDVAALGGELLKLDGYRTAVDARGASQQQTFDRYTGLIARHLEVFNTLSNVGLPGIDHLARPAIDENWGVEMISREDALLTRASVTGRLSAGDRAQLAGWIGSQRLIYDNKVVPLLPDDEAAAFRKLMAGSAWKEKTGVEQAVLGGTGTDKFSTALGKTWRSSVQQVTAGLQECNAAYSKTLTAATDDKLQAMENRLIVTSVTNSVAVVLVAWVTVLFTRMLRRRIRALHTAALDLQTRLPDVVERMRRGESVDPDAELPAIRYGGDELGQLGQALNLARHTALDTTVAQVGQFHGFEKLLQRIARRTQLLIGLQMKKLSELERKHEDPEVLEDLFDLDHLTARLRRYEENLVILGGGQPQRRWRKPVLLLDVLRSAQSEVQDYRRIQIEVEGRLWLSERAVGLVIHILAELMENAVGFSRPPTPVEVYAARVGRGLAVEIEDRGVGMDDDQYEAINRLMADPPRMDVMSRADDVRLGLYVVARLAQGLGLHVELRPSAFGGTRVVVLIPNELVVVAAAEQVVAASGHSETGPEQAVASWPPAPDTVTHAGPDTGHEADPGAGHPVPVGGPPGTDDPLGAEWFGPRPYGVPQVAGGRRADAGPETVGAPYMSATPETVGAPHMGATPETADAPYAKAGRETLGPPPGNLGWGLAALPTSAAPVVVKPLPKRVRQASLVDELRNPDAAVHARPDDERTTPPRPTPARSGATIGAFQRQSRLVRSTSTTADHGSAVVPPRRSIPTED